MRCLHQPIYCTKLCNIWRGIWGGRTEATNDSGWMSMRESDTVSLWLWLSKSHTGRETCCSHDIAGSLTLVVPDIRSPFSDQSYLRNHASLEAQFSCQHAVLLCMHGTPVLIAATATSRVSAVAFRRRMDALHASWRPRLTVPSIHLLPATQRAPGVCIWRWALIGL